MRPIRLAALLASTLLAALLLVPTALAGTAMAAQSVRKELALSPGEQRILPGEGVEAISTSTPWGQALRAASNDSASWRY